MREVVEEKKKRGGKDDNGGDCDGDVGGIHVGGDESDGAPLPTVEHKL